MKARVIALHHIQLAMPPNGEEKAVHFYQDLLGIPQLVKPAGLDAAGCWFEEGDLRVHLGVEQTFVPAKKAHPGLLVRDLPEVIRNVQAAGFEAIWDDRLEGFTRAYVTDPFGNRVELMEPLK
jgi:catechol 2,3-dioxygenase-like lactoylglutathione lyase family enzyme